MERSATRGLLFAILLIAGLVLVGVYAYNAGVTAGLAEGSRVLAPGDRVASPYIYPGFYGYGPGFGFFGFFGALLFFLLFFGLLRAIFWGGPADRGRAADAGAMGAARGARALPRCSRSGIDGCTRAARPGSRRATRDRPVPHRLRRPGPEPPAERAAPLARMAG